ncbi:MAG: transketolase [Spirochaetota bacterium]
MSTMSTGQLESLAKEFRYVITDMICRAGSGHLGGSLSLVEIITTLYYRIMNVHADNYKWEERDRLILSKGHAGPVLYVVLAYLGFFPKEWLKTLNQNGTNLPSHVDHNKTPGIDMTAGSLGQGLSCACGMSYAAKLNKKNYNVFCIIGDGESNEGQIWEAAMFAGHNKLDNLVVICDYNKMQIDGKTDDVVTLEPLADKWRAFNFEVFEMDGHNWDDIYSTINKAIEVKGKPSMIIAHTIKGKGNAEVENKVSSHNIKINNQRDYEKYMKGLGYSIPLPY